MYHLISRLVDREWYITTDDERRRYLTLLENASSKTDWQCLAYAIMSNHIHLAFIAGEQTLASWIRRVHAPFAGWMNRRHDRIGPLFVRGPKDIEVGYDGIGEVLAYIHNNPVRAGVVGAAHQSSWTSHRAYLGLEPAPSWLHVDAGLSRAGFRDDARAFDAWVHDPASERPHIERVEQALKPMVVRRPDPSRVHLLPALVRATASELAMPLSQLCSPRRGSAEVLGRQVAVHCGGLLGLTGAELARALTVSEQAISLIRRRDVRDDVQVLAARVMERLALPANDTADCSRAA